MGVFTAEEVTLVSYSTEIVSDTAEVAVDAGLTAVEVGGSFVDPLLAVGLLSQAPQLISQLSKLFGGGSPFRRRKR